MYGQPSWLPLFTHQASILKPLARTPLVIALTALSLLVGHTLDRRTQAELLSCSNIHDQALIGDTPITPLFPSPAYGMHLSAWWNPNITDRDMTLVSEMGFGWVKQSVAWRDVENHFEKGAYDWYRLDQVILPAVESHDLKLIVRLDRPPAWSFMEEEGLGGDNGPPIDYQEFGNFCHTIADRYKGRIDAYQVWNEPNLHREWWEKTPNPADYTRLLATCYEGIKSADPNAIVVSAGLAPTATNDATAMPDEDFLRGMYEAGADQYFDVLGLNAPGYAAPPELDPALAVSKPSTYGGFRVYAFRHVEDMRRIMLEYGDGASQIALLEMGWITDDPAGTPVNGTLETLHNSYAWFAVDAETQADYLARAYEYAACHWSPWIGLMTTVYISDEAWTAEGDEQWWWSIVLPDGTKRPAYNALKNMEKQ